MLHRYQMKRGARLAELPRGTRQDTRKHTRHVLRPSPEPVDRYLADPTERAWAIFEKDYRRTLDHRFDLDRAPFDRIADLARTGDVYLGCSCPTRRNPRVQRCHTWLALEFMRLRYPELEVRFPQSADHAEGDHPKSGERAGVGERPRGSSD